MRIAVLDLGGSALTFVAATATAGGWFQEHRREGVVLRLGRAIERTGSVPDGQVELVVETVRRLRAAAVRSGVDGIVAYVRSDLTVADNAGEFLARVGACADLELRGLTQGEELALLDTAVVGALGTARGTRTTIDLDDDAIRIVGGGAERVLRPGLRDRPAGPVDALAFEGHEGRSLVMTGSSAEALTRVARLRKRAPDLASVHGMRLDRGALASLCSELDALDPTQLLLLDGVHPSEADRVAAAAKVLRSLLRRIPTTHVTYCAADLGVGIVLDALDIATGLSTPAEVRAGTVRDLRDRYLDDRSHGDLVADLACDLFDELRELHELPAADRELLAHAARLHDVAHRTHGAGAHRHAGDLLLGTLLRGFDPTQVALLACLVRFQRGRVPGAHFAPYGSLDRDTRRRCDWLTALLRLAHGLDVGRDAAVRRVGAQVTSDLLVLDLEGADLDMAVFGARGERALLERLCGRRVLIRRGGHARVFDRIRVREVGVPASVDLLGGPAR